MAKKEGSTTKSFILRVDSATMDAIEAWAEDEFRSVNGQIQWILAEALKKSGRLKKKKAHKRSLPAITLSLICLEGARNGGSSRRRASPQY